MDQGAHFNCCDLQAHTPRDRQWSGDCPVAEEDRRTFAREFIAACRTKGLNAVGITDHHDLAFYSYIRDAAASETDENDQLIDADRRIVVFPGIEVTISLPCQALVLFDPNIEDEALSRVLVALGIEAAPPEAPKANQVVRLPGDLDDLHERLNAQSLLRNRFIVLPNLNDGGDDTLLRTGFFRHYKEMECVGGYVDGSYLGHRKRHIVEGGDPQWGNKMVGVIQTSDSRERDFSRLGSSPTWIKWSVPCTEALRQACLAPASRLKHSSPSLPDCWVSKMRVSDSKYFGPFNVEFNPQANMIVGGRGSGKSTILEYLRWALCDQPYGREEEEGTELPDYEKRRHSLVSATLSGSVSVEYIRNGVIHEVRREAPSGRVYLKVADQQEEETNEEVVQNLANIRGYSQKQLSHVGVRTSELLRLLTLPITKELQDTGTAIQDARSALRQAFERDESRRSLELQLQNVGLDLRSKTTQAESLKKEVTDLPSSQQAAIEAHPAFLAGQRLANQYRQALSDAIEGLVLSSTSVSDAKDALPDVGHARPDEPLARIRQTLKTGLEQAARQVDQAVAELRTIEQQLTEEFARAQTDFASHRTEYNAATSQNATIQHKLDSLRSVSTEIDGLTQTRDTLKAKIQELGDTAAELASARASWTKAVSQESELLETQAAELTKISGDELKVVVKRGEDVEALKSALMEATRGAGITVPDKFDRLFQAILSSSDRLAAWLEVGEELLALARVGPQLATGASLPQTPKFTSADFIATELRRIAGKLSPQTAFGLTLLFPKSVPTFEYRTAGGAYVPFEDASPGQQANALVSLLLNQPAGPLVIDQPEDDLDNSTILTVSERLWNAKEKGQVIFSTHNPNLVVIGDAELVLHCDYQQPVQSAKVHIAREGAIDGEGTCEVIKSVMEGGEAAFRLRMQKYGF